MYISPQVRYYRQQSQKKEKNHIAENTKSHILRNLYTNVKVQATNKEIHRSYRKEANLTSQI